MKKYIKIAIILLITLIFLLGFFFFSKEDTTPPLKKQDFAEKEIQKKPALTFFNVENISFDTKEKIRGKTYINKILLGDFGEIDEVIVKNDVYKAIGAKLNLTFDNILSDLKDNDFSEINLTNSSLNFSNGLIDIIISGQFNITKLGEDITIVSNGANIKSSFFDISADIMIENDTVELKIQRGFLSNDIISSFNITGELSFEKGVIKGSLYTPTANIKNIDFKDINLTFNGNPDNLDINIISKDSFNTFKGDVKLTKAKINSNRDISIKLNITGKEKITANLKGEIPLSFSMEDILREGFLKGAIKAKIKNIKVPSFMKNAKIELDGDVDISKDNFIIKTKKEIVFDGTIEDSLYTYMPKEIKALKNKIKLTPSSNKHLVFSTKPKFQLSNAKIDLANKKGDVKGYINNLTLDGSLIDISFDKIKMPLSNKTVTIHHITGKANGDIDKKITGTATINYDIKKDNFSIENAIKNLKFETTKTGEKTTSINYFKADVFKTISPEITLEKIHLKQEKNKKTFTAQSVKTGYNLFAPFKLKGEIDSSNNITASLSNNTLKFDIAGKNASKTIDLNLKSEPFEFSPKNILKLKGKIKNYVSGTIKPEANIKILKNDYMFNGSANINFKDITLDGTDHSIELLNSDLKINTFYPLTMEKQSIKASLFSFRDLNLFSNFVEFSVKDNILNLHQARAKLGAGNLTVSPFFTDLSSGEAPLVVKVEGCKTQDILNLAKLQQLNATGYVSGQIPFNYNIKDNTYKIINGALFSSGKGHFSYKQIPIGDIIIPDMNVTMTKGALEDFYFDSLHFFIEKEYNKAANIKTLLRGYSPNFWNGKRSALNLDLSPVFERLFSNEEK